MELYVLADTRERQCISVFGSFLEFPVSIESCSPGDQGSSGANLFLASSFGDFHFHWGNIFERTGLLAKGEG